MVSIKTELAVFHQPQGVRDLVTSVATSFVAIGWALGITASGPGDKSFWKSQYTNYIRMSTGQSGKFKSVRLRNLI